MANTGDSISYANFSKSYTGGVVLDKDTNSSHNTYVTYVSSPSWWAQITINKNFGTWGRSFTLTAAYWNGSKWVDAWSDSHSFGQMESGSWTYKYYHNSTLGSTSGDVPDAVLWELYFDHPELYRKRLWVYSGGAGCMPESTYNDKYQGRPIYSCGRLGGDSIYVSGEAGRMRDKIRSDYFNQGADSGTKQIAASREYKLTAYKYN